MAFRKPNRTRELAAPNGRADTVEHFDLPQMRAEQNAARAAAAAAAAQAPATLGAVAALAGQQPADRLAALLDALTLRPLRTRALPPPALVAEFDLELARLLEAADAAHGHAVGAALDYDRDEPLALALAGGDVDAIVDAITAGRARLFAVAYVAQLDARAADDTARAYAGRASELIAELDRETDRIRDEIRELWTRARDREDRRALEDGDELCTRWRALKRLWDWCRAPAYPYVAGGTYPGELEFLRWEADAAVSGTPAPLVPGHALALPGAPPPSEANRRTR